MRRTRWAEQNEAHFPILFWDPETMYNWVESVWSGESDAEPQLPYTRARMGNAVGLIVDATAVPTPTEPIWRD